MKNGIPIHLVLILYLQTMAGGSDYERSSDVPPIVTTSKSTTKGLSEDVCPEGPENPKDQFCPEGLTYHVENKQTFCYYLTKRQRFPPKCPYPNLIPRMINTATDLQNNQTIWLMALRNTTNGFGQFEWIDQDISHGLPIVLYSNPTNNITGKNCLVVDNDTFVPVSCNELYPALCVYIYYNYDYTNTYCKAHYVSSDSNGYNNCVASSIDIEDHSCYCESDKERNLKLSGNRNLFCYNLAEPLTQIQNYILLKQLYMHNKYDQCWFGLYKDNDGVLKWNQANIEVTYTTFVADTNCSKPYGAIVYDGINAWTLADDDGKIQCGICELQNTYKNVSIQLKYISTQNLIELRIKNPLELSNAYSYFYLIFCYIGPIQGSFKIQIHIEIDVESNVHTLPGDLLRYISNVYDYPIYYWCEGFQRPNLTHIYSNTIMAYVSGTREYAIQVIVPTTKNQDPYLENLHLIILQEIGRALGAPYNTTLRTINILTYNQKNSYMEMLLHVTTSLVIDEQIEFDDILKQFQKMQNSNILILTSFGRSDVCLPSSTNSGSKLLHWPKTVLGAVTLPIEPCLQLNRDPVMRQCTGDFLQGAIWSSVNGSCDDDMHLSENAHELNELLHNDYITSDELSSSLSRVTEETQNDETVEIYLIAKLLEKLETFGNDVNTNDVITTISNIMNFRDQQLRKAQEMINCTDKILSSLDNILAQKYADEPGSYHVISSNRLVIQISDIRKSDVTGLALQKHTTNDSFTVIPLYANFTLQEVLQKDNIELATFLPPKLIEEIKSTSLTDIKLIISVFYNDVLFNEHVEQARQANSRIIGIAIPAYFYTFNTSFPIIFKPIYKTEFDAKCTYWNYGLNELMISIRGSWSEDTDPEDIKDYAICNFDHATHFSLLMMGRLTKDFSDKHTMALNIITAIGATVSLVSILAMFVITTAYKSLRQNSSNKIILNFSISIALQIILLYISGSVNKNATWCVAVGASLHYTLLSEFCWMLIIGILQYKKFVIVFHAEIHHFLAKACVFSWLFPLLPIAIILTISKESYAANPEGFCYPSGNYFYFGVILPIVPIVLINITIFIKIILSVCHRKAKAYGPKQNDVKLQVMLAVFLFFLLGISWTFGIAVAFGASVVFAYLLCLTSTFQGLVIFSFFITMNETFKRSWLQIKNVLCCNNQMRRTSAASERRLRTAEIFNAYTDGMEISARLQL